MCRCIFLMLIYTDLNMTDSHKLSVGSILRRNSTYPQIDHKQLRISTRSKEKEKIRVVFFFFLNIPYNIVNLRSLNLILIGIVDDNIARITGMFSQHKRVEFKINIVGADIDVNLVLTHQNIAMWHGNRVCILVLLHI
jgi:hypothetical protein